MSIAVWVGLIALLGVDAQTGVFMLLYLDLTYDKASREGRLRTLAELQATIVEGAAKRLRPKFMTMATTFIGLMPIMWATGTGSDVWKRIAAPMVGGILTSFVLELVVYPAIYEIWKWHFEMKRAGFEPQAAAFPALATPQGLTVTVTETSESTFLEVEHGDSQGKGAVVTGAASGIGKAIATAFIEAGASVLLCDVNAKGLETVTRELGERAIGRATDVSDESQVEPRCARHAKPSGRSTSWSTAQALASSCR